MRCPSLRHASGSGWARWCARFARAVHWHLQPQQRCCALFRQGRPHILTGRLKETSFRRRECFISNSPNSGRSILEDLQLYSLLAQFTVFLCPKSLLFIPGTQIECATHIQCSLTHSLAHPDTSLVVFGAAPSTYIQCSLTHSLAHQHPDTSLLVFGAGPSACVSS